MLSLSPDDARHAHDWWQRRWWTKNTRRVTARRKHEKTRNDVASSVICSLCRSADSEVVGEAGSRSWRHNKGDSQKRTQNLKTHEHCWTHSKIHSDIIYCRLNQSSMSTTAPKKWPQACFSPFKKENWQFRQGMQSRGSRRKSRDIWRVLVGASEVLRKRRKRLLRDS